MSDESNFQTLIARVRQGEAAAAAELHRIYGEQLQRIVRVRFTDPGLRRQMDSLDICQSVFGDFFVRMALGQYDISAPDDLLRLLSTMARHRVIHHAKRQKADRRDVRRTVGASIDDLPLAAEVETPSVVVAGEELLARFHEKLSPTERQIAEQRRDGRSWDEIAAGLGRSSEAVRKAHERSLRRIADELGIGVDAAM